MTIDPPPRPPKEEKAPATEDIDEVAPGVLRSQLPIDLPGLGHVNCYLLEDADGVAVVDPGLPTKESNRALTRRLTAAGFPLSSVHTIVITHSHHDHYGGANWLQSHADAKIVTHRAFRTLWNPIEPPDTPYEDIETIADDGIDLTLPRFPWGTPVWGGPGIAIAARRRWRYRLERVVPRLRRAPRPTHRLDDADTISLAGRSWVAVHTPGHTHDHLCLFDPEAGCMLCGDHVLPTITPHIGGWGRERDPLGDFMSSLDTIAAYGPQVRVALPAHGKPFVDLAGRARAIAAHHLERLDLVRTTVDALDHPVSVMEMSTHLFAPRSQGGMADSETYAHLEHLRRNGEMRRVRRDGVLLYERAG